MRHIVVNINSNVPIVTNEKPIIILNKNNYYVLNNELTNAINAQISISVQDSSCYNVVGYIEKGKLTIDDKKNTVEISGYDMRKYLWE